MFELMIILGSLVTVALSSSLYRKASGEPVSKLNMLSYSFWLLLALSVIAAIVLALDVPFLNYDPVASGYLYGDRGHRLAVWAMVMWTIIGIPLGAIFSNSLSDTRSIRTLMVNYRNSTIQVGLRLNERSLFKIVLISSGALAVVSLLQLPETTALANVIATGDVVGSQIIRRQTREGSGIALIDALFNEGTLQWLSYIALAMSIVTARWRWWLLFGVLFLIVFYLNLSSGVIGRILYYFLGIAFVRAILGKGFVKIYELFGMAVLLVALFVMFKGAEADYITVLSHAVTSRILFTQLLGTYLVLDIFPRQHEFIGFASTARMIHEMLGSTTLDSYGIIIMNWYNPAGVEAGYAGHLTTVFIGEAWANFGLIGVIVAPLWVGVVVQLVNRAFIRRRKTVVAVALYAYLAITFGYASDFVGFYYPLGTVLFVLGAFSILMLGRLFVAKPSQRRGRVESANLLKSSP